MREQILDQLIEAEKVSTSRVEHYGQCLRTATDNAEFTETEIDNLREDYEAAKLQCQRIRDSIAWLRTDSVFSQTEHAEPYIFELPSTQGIPHLNQ